jgi:cytochrome c oxidase cbb3-type subunit 3
MHRWLAGLVLLIPAAALPAGPDGAGLFAEHCSACHGADGTGGVGTPLALDSFLSTVTDEYLLKTIRHGRPGRVMPAFQKLSNAQAEAIVGHIRSLSDARPPEHPEGPVDGDAARGAPLYADHCAECHGERGLGGQGTGVTFSRTRDLPIVPPALNNSGFLAAASDQMIRATIAEGRDGTPMKAYAGRLSDREIADITAYIRSFEDDTPPIAAADEDLPFTLEYESPYDLETTVENVRRAAVGANFKVIRSDRLEHGLVAEGDESPDQMFVDFCNFGFLYEALKIDPRIGMYLPCRISVVDTGEGVRVMSVNPMALARLFNNRELDQVCDTMHDRYVQILEEATF